MSEKSERAAREIERVIHEAGMSIDGGELRDILEEEFEKALSGGDVEPCPRQPAPHAPPAQSLAESAENCEKGLPLVDTELAKKIRVERITRACHQAYRAGEENQAEEDLKIIAAARRDLVAEQESKQSLLAAHIEAKVANVKLRQQLEQAEAKLAVLERENDGRDEREAEYAAKMTKELQAQIAARKDVEERANMALAGKECQVEALRRELDKVNQHVKEMLERQAEKEKHDHFPFTPKDWPT